MRFMRKKEQDERAMEHVTTKTSSYSVLLPTYNERDNLPLMVCLIADAFEKAYVYYVERRDCCALLLVVSIKSDYICWSSL